jgi:transposase-like protein
LNFTGQSLISKAPISFQQQYDQFAFQALTQVACPKCQNPAGITRHGSYLRQFYLTASQRIKITVTRARCHACDRTFVLLPASVAPYKRYILETMLKALRLARSKSIYAVENTLDICASTIRRWQMQFEKWHKVLYISHGLNRIDSAEELGSMYAHERLGRRFMQIISAWTPLFHRI